MPKNILVVDDEEDIAELVCVNLEKDGFRTRWALDGRTGLDLALTKWADLIILDVMMPRMDGWEVCKNLRADPRTAATPIVMLTAKGEESDKVLGLELGADDYLAKPFSPRELVARIRALLRRTSRESQGAAKAQLKYGSLEIDSVSYEVKVKGKAVALTAKEFQLLYFLANRPNRVITREILMDEVWSMDSDVETRTVDVHMRRLRKKLGKAAGHLQTVRSVGYKFSGNP
jgi:DNA-binding response OmpR family regulator